MPVCAIIAASQSGTYDVIFVPFLGFFSPSNYRDDASFPRPSAYSETQARGYGDARHGPSTGDASLVALDRGVIRPTCEE